MNILMLSETDPAGTAIMFCNAINDYTEHSCRLITTKSPKYPFGFEKDIHIEGDKIFMCDIPLFPNYQFLIDTLEKLLKDTDIFHFHILSDESMEIGPFKVKDFIKGKKVIHHHHGCDDFRNNPDKYRLKYKKMKRKILVATPDLLLGLPEATWQPNLIPINDPDYMPTEERYPEFTIGHSPTRTDLKDTLTLLEAAHKAGVNVDIIMNTEHRACLRRKQKCHVIFDHLQGYYGLSSLEGLSMGKPVIANLSDWVKVNIRGFAETEDLPWTKLWPSRSLVYAEDLENAYWQRNDSRKFMEAYWNPKKVVDRLIKFYETL